MRDPLSNRFRVPTGKAADYQSLRSLYATSRHCRDTPPATQDVSPPFRRGALEVGESRVDESDPGWKTDQILGRVVLCFEGGEIMSMPQIAMTGKLS
jgi:hypothetical protein